MNRALLLVLLATLLAMPQVTAHAEPYQSSPGSGERLAEPPQEVVVAFTERVYEEGSWIEVWDLSGTRVDLDDLRITPGERPVMRVSVPPLDDGPYLVKWQTYSQTDGHTIRGAIGFSIGGFAPPNAENDAGEVPVGAGMARGLTYLGYVLAIGAIAFGMLVLRGDVNDRQRRRMDLAMATGAVLHLAGVVWLLVDTALATGIGVVDFLASAGGRDLWLRALVAVALAVLSGLWLYGPVRPRTTVPVLTTLWVVAVALGARFGHAATPASWFVQSVHGLAIAAWLGGLFMLFASLLARGENKKDARKARELGVRFSTLAIGAVSLMAVTGFALALTVLGRSLFDPSMWASDPWRSFLTMKIALVAAMILLAIINREVFLAGDDEVGRVRRSVRRFADRFLRWQPIHQHGGTSDFRKVVAIEAGIGVAVLVCAGFLMSVAAPAEGLESSAATYETTGVGDAYTALLRVTPEPADGHFSDVRVYLQTDEEEPEPLEGNTCVGEGDVRDDCVRMRWWPQGQGANASQEVVGVPEGDGWWLFERVLWSTDGAHDVVVDLSTRYLYADSIPMTVQVLQDRPSE